MVATSVNNLNVGLDLGKLLKILSDGAVYNQLSTASDLWMYILKKKAREDNGRELRYEIMTNYGPAAVQFTGFGSTAAYPAGQKSTLVEATAQYKDIDLTVEYDLTLEKRTGQDLLQYARPLAHEMDAKGIVAARILSAAIPADGSGAIGIISAIDATDNATGNTGEITLTINTDSSNAGRSHIGWFELGDIIKAAATASNARTLVADSGNVTTAQIVNVDVENDKITIGTSPADNSPLSEDGTWAVGDLIYRTGITPNDLSTIAIDYNALSEMFPGLETLAATDGRLVNGVTMTGAASGSRQDVGGAIINSKDFQKLLSKIKRRVGAKRYQFDRAHMHYDTYDAMVELAEADKTFFNTVDFATGARKIGYQHAKDFIEFIPDEFIQKSRIFILPTNKGVLEFHGRDFERVNIGGQREFLKTSATSGQYLKQAQAFMSASGVLVAKHPAAIGVMENFVFG